MSTMLTKTQLIKTFNQGDMETIYKELTRYATMTFDKYFDVDSGFYAGANRIQKWEHKGLQWESLKINGEVERMSLTMKE